MCAETNLTFMALNGQFSLLISTVDIIIYFGSMCLRAHIQPTLPHSFSIFFKSNYHVHVPRLRTYSKLYLKFLFLSHLFLLEIKYLVYVCMCVYARQWMVVSFVCFGFSSNFVLPLVFPIAQHFWCSQL